MTVCPRIRARLDSCAPQQGAVAGTGSGTRRGQAGSAAVEAGDPHAAESCHPARNWQSSLGHSRTAFQFVNERGALACT